MTSRLMSMFLLKERSVSRCRRALEVSTQVSCEIRSESGGDSPVGETRSGVAVVRARAMLQLLAPRSRTFGISRLISCIGSH